MPDEVRVLLNRAKALRSLAVIVVIMGLGIWIALTASPGQGSFIARRIGVLGTRIVCWAGEAAMLYSLVSVLWLLTSRAVLIVSGEGVWNRRLWRQRVAWREVVRLERWSLTKRARFVKLVRASGRPIYVGSAMLRPPYDSIDRLQSLMQRSWELSQAETT